MEELIFKFKEPFELEKLVAEDPTPDWAFALLTRLIQYKKVKKINKTVKVLVKDN